MIARSRAEIPHVIAAAFSAAAFSERRRPPPKIDFF
jgi:hypothetical protein